MSRDGVSEPGYSIADFKIRYLKEDGNGVRMKPSRWVPYVSWEDLKDWEHHDELIEWMRGKTCLELGIYPWNLESFIAVVDER